MTLPFYAIGVKTRREADPDGSLSLGHEADRATSVDMARLEDAIVGNPLAGDVGPWLGGLRKLRFGLGDKGKRGGGRAIYFVMVAEDAAALLCAYAKSAQANLTADQRRAVLALMKELTDDER